MNARVEAVLDELESSGESSAVAVADHLRTVAENGGEQATQRYLVNQAVALIGWAQEFIKRVSE